MSNIRAVDVPELRAGLIEYLESDFGMGQIRQYFGEKIRVGSGDDQTDTEVGYGELSAVDLRQSAVETLKHAGSSLFFVSSQMMAVAKTAAATLAGFTLEARDLPSPHGFMVFEDPYALYQDQCAGVPAEILAVAWTTSLPEGESCGLLSFEFYSDWHRYLDEVADSYPAEEVKTGRAFGHRLYFETFTVSPLGISARGSEMWDRAFGPLVAPVISAWLLMQQPLARMTEVEPYRAARKRLRRLGQEPKPVRVIELRRPKSETSGDSESRDWHHQWIVRGHWRQQWYPSRGAHRPVWIAPHIKGPEGAPMLGGEKVHAWVR